jgi:hypothetical protein
MTLWGTIVAIATLGTPLAAQPTRTLDSFDSPRPWTAVPSDGVSLALASDSGVIGRALRLDVDFHGGGGYAVAHRALPIDLPANYAFTFWLKSDLPPNTLEFKLIDSTGQNVWWATRRDMTFSRGWSKITIRKRQISFAWGPLGGGELRHAAALEISVTAGSGGKGHVWLDELALVTLPPPATDDKPPRLVASSAVGGIDAAPPPIISLVAPNAPLAATPTSGVWRSAADGEQWVALDFGAAREYGGLVVDWDTADYARDYDIQASDDGNAWTTLRTVARAAEATRCVGSRCCHCPPARARRPSSSRSPPPRPTDGGRAASVVSSRTGRSSARRAGDARRSSAKTARSSRGRPALRSSRSSTPTGGC